MRQQENCLLKIRSTERQLYSPAYIKHEKKIYQMTNQSNQFPLHHTLSYISPIFAFPVISSIHICYTLGRSYALHKSETIDQIEHCTELRFASLLSSGFSTMAVINSLENKLHCKDIACKKGNFSMSFISRIFSMHFQYSRSTLNTSFYLQIWQVNGCIKGIKALL